MECVYCTLPHDTKAVWSEGLLSFKSQGKRFLNSDVWWEPSIARCAR